MEIRLATVDDAQAIMEIYNVSVLKSTSTFDIVPRTLGEQQRWIEDRSGAHVVLVAIEGDDVCGFGSLSTYRDRPAYSTTVEDSVYVSGEHQNKGVGRALLAELLKSATDHGFHAVMARVVGDHEASIALHTSLGFEIIGHEREVGRKFGKWLDVVLLERLLA